MGVKVVLKVDGDSEMDLLVDGVSNNKVEDGKDKSI